VVLLRPLIGRGNRRFQSKTMTKGYCGMNVLGWDKGESLRS